MFTTYPHPEGPDAPDHVPEDVARVFKQAVSAHNRAELDGAAILFRKTLEVAVKRLAPEGKGSLQQRIDALAASDVIPSVVGKWAHEIRIVANDAAHEAEEPDATEVTQIAEFTEAFLEYVFTMAEKFRQRQILKDKPK